MARLLGTGNLDDGMLDYAYETDTRTLIWQVFSFSTMTRELDWRVIAYATMTRELDWAVQGFYSMGRTVLWDVQPSVYRIHHQLGSAPVINAQFLFEHRTINNEFLADWTNGLLGGSIEGNNDRAIFRLADLEIAPAKIPELNPLKDIVGIDLLLTVDGNYQQRIPCGLFQLDAPETRFFVNAKAWKLGASDLTVRLATDYPGSTYVVASGTNYVAAIQAILNAAGLRNAIPATTKTLPAAQTFTPDQSWLEIVNKLCNDIDYYGVWADEYGVIITRAQAAMDRVTPAVTYTSRDFITTDEITDEADYNRMANKVVAYRGDATAGLLSSTRTNADPASPISTVNLGRTITKLIAVNGAPDQATLDGIAARELADAASLYRRVKLTTKLDPRRGAHEVYKLVSDEYPSENYWCRNWKFDMSTGASMAHELARVEKVLAT